MSKKKPSTKLTEQVIQEQVKFCYKEYHKHYKDLQEKHAAYQQKFSQVKQMLEELQTWQKLSQMFDLKCELTTDYEFNSGLIDAEEKTEQKKEKKSIRRGMDRSSARLHHPFNDEEVQGKY